jgi:hypothetical protein
MTNLKYIASIAVVLFSEIAGWASEPIKLSTVTDAAEPASAEMMNLLRKKFEAHANLFKLVSAADPSLGIVLQADCMERRRPRDLYVCFYTLHYSGGNGKTFMGGGVNTAQTPDEIADGFLASVAQDIVENMNGAIRTNAVESLESCLLLTQSSCAVPEVLASELKAKIINLSQYLQRGGLDKTKSAAAQQK